MSEVPVNFGRRRDDCSEGHRAACPMISEAAMEELAEKAAERAIEKVTGHVYQQIGKSFVSKMLYILGALSVGGYLWLQAKGYIK